MYALLIFSNVNASEWILFYFFFFLQILVGVLYTTVRYRCDPSILDHYDESYFGENAEREIFRRKKEQSCESWSEAEELDKVIFPRTLHDRKFSKHYRKLLCL